MRLNGAGPFGLPASDPSKPLGFLRTIMERMAFCVLDFIKAVTLGESYVPENTEFLPFCLKQILAQLFKEELGTLNLPLKTFESILY